MGFLNDLFSGGASTLVGAVGKVLDNVITTKEEKQQLDIELRKSEQLLRLLPGLLIPVLHEAEVFQSVIFYLLMCSFYLPLSIINLVC